MSKQYSDDFQAIFSGKLIQGFQSSKSALDTQTEADHIESVLRLPPSAHVLDVPCGGGRVALELAARGYQLSGIDISETFIDNAKQESKARGLPLDVRTGDMRQLPWRSVFDAAYCFWESFGYFDDEGNRAFVNAVSQALKPGGRFLIDTHVAETVFHDPPQRSWGWHGETLWLEEWIYEPTQSRMYLHWIFVRPNGIDQNEYSVRIYTYRELCALLAEAGFGDFEGYELLSRRPFRLGGGRLNLLAVKQ